MPFCRHLLLLSALLTECALAQVSLPGSAASGALTVCVEDTVSQHGIFTDDSPSGIRMWALRMASEKAGIPVSLTFRPWKRCLRDVSRGETEAIAFVTYAGKNKDLFAFPMKAGEVDTHSAMNSGAIALYRRKGEAKDFKNGKFFPDGVVVGSRLGLVIIEVAMQSKNATLVEATNSDELVFKMLQAKRFDIAAFTEREGDQLVEQLGEGKIEKIREPLITTHSYLAFNKSVFESRKALAQTLWAEIAHARKSKLPGKKLAPE